MKINPNSTVVNVVNKLNDQTTTQVSDPDGKKGKTESSVVNFSSRAEQMAQIHAELKDVPDVRMEKVDKIKAEIAAGTYERNSEDVAQKLISDSLLMSVYKI